MTTKLSSSLLAVLLLAHATHPAWAESSADIVAQATASSVAPKESAANTQAFPKQILRTGINLNDNGISANTAQLAGDIHLTAILERIQTLRERIASLSPSPERNESRLDLLEAKEQATAIITKTNLEIDFVVTEMNAEQNLYNEILGSFAASRDKTLAMVNAASFGSNGVLWTVCEALAIPSYSNPKLSISSGITGILAGLVPSVASAYTLKAVNGKKKTSEVEPNMLAKLFNYPVNTDIEYPSSVWQFLNQVPAAESKTKTRRDQLVDRWVADSNIPGFTNRNSKEQLNVVTASVAQKKGLSIATLSTRNVMLQQLSAEVLKMKRMLLELAMVVQGEKQFVVMQSNNTPLSKAQRLTPPPIPKRIASASDEKTNSENLTAQKIAYPGVP